MRIDCCLSIRRYKFWAVPVLIFCLICLTNYTFNLRKELQRQSLTNCPTLDKAAPSFEMQPTIALNPPEAQEIQIESRSGKSQNCTRKNNIMFLKTHKTASSAVQNILLRYGTHYNLTFAMPNNKHNFGFPAAFQPATVHDLKGKENFNILCHHMRYNHEQVRAVMPGNSFYFSIMREPGALFESAFDYLWQLVPAFKRVKHEESPEKWLDNAKEYFETTPRGNYWFFAKNPTMYDFGYDSMNEDDAFTSKAIQEIEQRFDLMLIADHYEESMVLLSDALCWSIEEVACLSLNSRKHDKIDSAAKARVRDKARAWNKGDTALFDHFNATLWKKIEAYGFDRMRQKLNLLQEANKHLSDICIEGGKAVDSSKLSDPAMKQNFYKPAGVSVGVYNLKKSAEENPLCRELVMPENAFSNMVFKRQYP